MNNTYFQSADNSGADKILLITNLSRKGKRAKIGDLIVGVVKKVNYLNPNIMSNIIYGVIVRTKEIILERKWVLGFNNNSLVIVDKNLNPISSRIFGTIPLVLKQKGFLKLNSLAVDFI